MAWAALLQALPYIAQIGSAALPLITQATQNQAGSGSSSTASSQQQTSSSSMSSGGSSTSQSMQQGSPSGVAGTYQAAISNPTGSNWKDAFGASQGSAQTANNLQTGQWAMNNTINAFSNMMANLGNLWSQTSARKYNSTEAALNRQWQREMRQNAYQDTVSDLKAAGLNPILAASRGATDMSGGSQASISPGSFAQMTASAIPSAHSASAQTMYDYGNNTAQFINNAVSAIQSAKSIGWNQTASQFMQAASGIVESSASSINEYSQTVDELAKKDLRNPPNDLFHSNPETRKLLEQKAQAAKEKGRNAKQTPQAPYQHIRG